ncbi:MAG: MATE family efflux transporter [Firmicutes bacterium]|nr:MATE family efflux transporter [Bacillota bacterium]
MLKKYFGDKRFYKMALAVAVPIMIQNGITNAVAMLDNIMVGAVGTVQMTGVSIANTLMFVFNLTVFGAVSGAGIFGAQFIGKGDHDGVRYAMRFKLMICALLALLGIGIFRFFGDDLIRLYLTGQGQADQIEASLRYGKSYLDIMLVGIVPFVLVQCYTSTLRESGQTVVPMVAGLSAMLVNLLGNWLLIFGRLGLPELGADGAAIATVVSRFVEALIVMVWSHCHADAHPCMRGLYKSMRIPLRLAGKIAAKGLPLIINEALWAGSVALLNQCYSIRSYDVVAAINISTTISNVLNVAFLAMGNAIGIIIGQMLGAGELEKAKETDVKLIVFSEMLCLIFGTALAAVSGVFPKLYNTTEEIRSLASTFILISAALMPVCSYSNAAYFTLRCGGKTLVTLLFDSVFQCAVVAPVAFVLSRFTTLPIVPLYICCQGLELIKCIVGFVMIRSGVWLQNIVKEEATS